MKKIFLVVVMCLVSVCMLIGCGNKTAGSDVDTYDVNFEIVFEENLLLNKYHVSVSIDEHKIGEVEHGESVTLTETLEPGTHSITFTKLGDADVDGTEEFTVSEDMTIKYRLTAKRNQVEIIQITAINPPLTSDEIVDMKRKDVKSTFEEAGFTNIELKSLDDLTEEMLDQNNNTTKVSINKNSTFTTDDKFFSDSKVVIRYHSPLKVSPPEDYNYLDGEDYEDVVNRFKNAGFINVTTKPRETTWADNDEVAYISINGDEYFYTDDFFPITAKVVIQYYVYVEEEDDEDEGKSSTELSLFYAKEAFEDYGKSAYPYGFKCHWFTNFIHKEQRTDGSWYLKVGVTIENAYGNEIEAVAEGVVSGTDDFQYVNSFSVY